MIPEFAIAVKQGGWSVADVAAMVAALGSFGMLVYTLVSVLPKIKKNRELEVRRRVRLEDEILGRSAERGLPAMPSLGERIAEAMETLRSHGEALEDLKTATRQLRPNGGSSLADKVNRIEGALTDLAGKFTNAASQLESAVIRIQAIEDGEGRAPQKGK